MAIPKYDEMYHACLLCLKDRNEHSSKEIDAFCINFFSLTEEECSQQAPDGSRIINNRVSWTRVYLKKAGLIASQRRGRFQITPLGEKALKSQEHIDNQYLLQFSSFQEFYSRKKASQVSSIKDDESADESCRSLSPNEQIISAISEINSALADELMDEVMKISSYEFEKLIIKLLVAMGYGSALDNRDAVTKQSGDEGIDGVFKADKLGFDSIYIQAKQWKKDSVVGRPEIQKFVGAVVGQGASKGLFITTARYSSEAKEYADKNLSQKIVLVDGEMLAKLMIEFDIGVSTVETIKIKKVDTDFFTDFE